MKKYIIFVCTLMLALHCAVSAEERDITVMIDGKTLVCDTAPQIVNGRTMLPMRAVFEALGAKVTWVETDKLIFAMKADCMIVMQIGTEAMTVQKTGSEEKTVTELDAAPYIFNDRTMIPVRAAAEALNTRVAWDNDTRTVIISR